MSEPVLELTDVHVRIGAVNVLSGASVRVEAGSAVGLVGETGSGKTMVARAACGLLGRIGGELTRGSITVAGYDLTDRDQRRWRHLRGRAIALVPQSSLSGLDPLMRIGDQLRETVHMLNGAVDPARESERLLLDVRLQPDRRLLRAYPHELSGGMRQRVMIALALAGNPSMIVADEPTTALDAAIQRDIVDLLAGLQRERNLGLLLISHDLDLIAAATDTTVVIYGGQTVESGPTPDVLAAVAHPYTRALLAAQPRRGVPGTALPVIPGQPPLPTELGDACPFAPRCPHTGPECLIARPPLVAVGPRHLSACLQHHTVRG